MKKYLQIGICLIVSVLFLAGCKEDKGNIGLGVQPDDEFLNTDYFDKTTIIAYSAIHDSLITSNVSINMLGCLGDPIFGKTQAGIYTQFRLSATAVDFGDNVTVDSLVLTLVYAGYYGDTLNSFKLNVYELSESMSKSEKYYTTSSLSHNNIPLTENPSLFISPRPTVKTDTSASSYCLSVRLDKNFAVNKFISQSGGNVYASDANFLEHFKGLFLEATDLTGNGCMVSLNMTHALSKLTIYYSNSSQAQNLSHSFNLNDSTAHFGVFNHFNYANANANLRDQLSGNHANTKEVLYGQAGAGIKVVLNFPHLKETFKGKKVIIHRAVLTASFKDDALANYAPPSALSITSHSAIGLGGFMPDYFLSLQYQNDYFGGKYNQAKKEYAFHITQYIQGLVDGTWEDYPLNLSVSPSVTHFSRLEMYGTNPANDFNKRLLLKINYTIINK